MSDGPLDVDWQVTAASRRGSSHDRGPNQDAVRVDRVDLAGEGAVVAAVSDGHGGARYVRSDVGARLAVEAAVEYMAGVLREGAAGDVTTLRSCVDGVVAAWRAAVEAHHAEAPAGTDDDPVILYGATLILAVVRGERISVAQLGDGDVLAHLDGRVVRPVPGDARLVGGQTTSLCLRGASGDFRFGDVIGADLLLLASDGYGNSFAVADWQDRLVEDFVRGVRRDGFAVLSERLPGWLGESARIGGDDVTAVVAARSAPQRDLRASGDGDLGRTVRPREKGW